MGTFDRIRYRFVFLATLLVFSTVITQTAFSQLPYPSTFPCSGYIIGRDPCTDPWVTGSELVLVEVKSSPACSVYVTIYYSRKCDEVVIHDYTIGFVTTVPSGCAIPSDLNLGAGSWGLRIHQALIGKLMILGISSSNIPPNCPNKALMFGSTLATCQSAFINYLDGSGNPQKVPYDMINPWSYYQNVIIGPTGTFQSISVEPCLGSGHCRRCRTYCKDEQGVIHWEDGPSAMIGAECSTIEPPHGPCNVVNCVN